MIGNGISRKHFRIDFNWESGSLLLIDHSSHGTVVDSEATGKHTLRKNSVPIFNGDSIQAGLVRLRLKIPSHEAYQEAYDRNWQLYKKEHQEAIPINSFTGLAVVKPTQATLLETGRLSLLNGIGQGTAGVVYKAVDNEGNFFAVKMLFKPRSEYSEKSVVREMQSLPGVHHVSETISIHSRKALNITRSLISSRCSTTSTCQIGRER